MATFDEINQRFQSEIDRIAGPLTERAITMIFIQVGANTNDMIPKDTGFLANSVYRKVEPGMNGWKGEMGFGARYAAAVHEKPGTLLGTNTSRGAASRGTVWAPSGEPRFLEKGIQDTEPQFRDILRIEYRTR